MTDESPGVSIDAAHCALIAGLIRAQKPRSVLEFGWGGGKSAQAIQEALLDNGQACRHVLVDNWADWGGKQPGTDVLSNLCLTDIELVVRAEGDFVRECRETFDFILSDADHLHAHEWHIGSYRPESPGSTFHVRVPGVYTDLLNPGGILVYHDVCNFPNLGEIVTLCQTMGSRYVVFDKNSLPYEACQRGLLVIFKPEK